MARRADPPEPRVPRRPRKRQRTEGSIERGCVGWARERGVLSRKMNGLGFRDWPDRLFIRPRSCAIGPPSVWVEFKREGERVTGIRDGQARMISDLRARGHVVEICDSLDGFKLLMQVRWWPMR